MSNVLTEGELLDLTRTSQRKRQKELLFSFGVVPMERSDGSLAVTWEAINERMKGVTEKQDTGIDLSAI